MLRSDFSSCFLPFTFFIQTCRYFGSSWPKGLGSSLKGFCIAEYLANTSVFAWIIWLETKRKSWCVSKRNWPAYFRQNIVSGHQDLHLTDGRSFYLRTSEWDRRLKVHGKERRGCFYCFHRARAKRQANSCNHPKNEWDQFVIERSLPPNGITARPGIPTATHRLPLPFWEIRYLCCRTGPKGIGLLRSSS